MLRYKTETRPGLVALYDIQPGNGAGQFLQPGARTGLHYFVIILSLVTLQGSVCTHVR